MKIAAGWPEPKELIENEIATLDRMRNNSDLQQEQEKLTADAHRKYLYYKNKSKKRNQFSFGSWLKFNNFPDVTKACIECIIIADPSKSNLFSMVSYSFSLCRSNNEGKDHLLRKFHIDYTAFPNTGRPPMHPVFHLQSPGKLTPLLKKAGIQDDHLEPNLSEPRLYSTPITLALLTDFLLREFGGNPTTGLAKITSKPVWSGLIRNNENLVLRPYFNTCCSFFHDRECKKDPEKNQLFTQDFVYGQLG